MDLLTLRAGFKRLLRDFDDMTTRQQAFVVDLEDVEKTYEHNMEIQNLAITVMMTAANLKSHLQRLEGGGDASLVSMKRMMLGQLGDIYESTKSISFLINDRSQSIRMRMNFLAEG